MKHRLLINILIASIILNLLLGYHFLKKEVYEMGKRAGKIEAVNQVNSDIVKGKLVVPTIKKDGENQ